jgi:hypothetical protein
MFPVSWGSVLRPDVATDCRGVAWLSLALLDAPAKSRYAPDEALQEFYMATILGEAAMTDAERVIRRLCKHWSHKYPVQIEETSGAIQLNDVLVSLRAEPDRLHIALDNPQGDVPLRLTGVVAEHLQRMAGTEQVLDIQWSAPSQS